MARHHDVALHPHVGDVETQAAPAHERKSARNAVDSERPRSGFR